jgi:hypothetical protein
MLMRFNTLILGAALLAGSAGATDFKGIELDKTYSNETIQEKAGYQLGQFGNSIQCNVYCSGQIELAGGVSRAQFFPNKDDGSIGHINVITNVRDFDAIEKQLVEKFGRPSHVTHQALQNAFGAKVLNTVDEWHRPNGDEIELFRYIDMESGALSLKSAKYIAADKAFRAAREKDGKI